MLIVSCYRGKPADFYSELKKRIVALPLLQPNHKKKPAYWGKSVFDCLEFHRTKDALALWDEGVENAKKDDQYYGNFPSARASFGSFVMFFGDEDCAVTFFKHTKVSPFSGQLYHGPDLATSCVLWGNVATLKGALKSGVDLAHLTPAHVSVKFAQILQNKEALAVLGKYVDLPEDTKIGNEVEEWYFKATPEEKDAASLKRVAAKTLIRDILQSKSLEALEHTSDDLKVLVWEEFPVDEYQFVNSVLMKHPVIDTVPARLLAQTCSRYYTLLDRIPQYSDFGLSYPLVDVFDPESNKTFVQRRFAQWEGCNVFRLLSQNAPQGEVGKPSIVTSSAQFMQRFHEFSGGLFKNFDWTDVMVGGGAVVACLQAPELAVQDPDSDIDLFIYGHKVHHDYGQSTSPFGDIVTRIYKTLKANAPGNKLLMLRTLHTITFVPSKGRRVQLVLGYWPNPSNVLYEADVDCCGFGIVGEGKVYATPLARLAVNYRWNIVSTRGAGIRGQPAYERRLAKFSKRGFVVIDPLLQAGDDPEVGRMLLEAMENDTSLCYRPAAASDLPPQSAGLSLDDLEKLVVENGYVEADGYGQEEEGFEVLTEDALLAQDYPRPYNNHNDNEVTW